MYDNFKTEGVMQVKFHCELGGYVSSEEPVRAFLYSDYSIVAHNHDFYEINIILQGSGTHQIENSCFSVSVGDVFVIPPKAVHAYYNTDSLNVYHILLHPKFVDANRAEAESVPGFLQFFEIEPFLRQHFSHTLFLHLSGFQLIQLKADLAVVEDGGMCAGDRLSPLKYHTAWKIIYWLSQLLFFQIHDADKKTNVKYEREMIRTLEYIHQNYDEKITTETLRALTFLSRSTFLRSFTEMCGCPPIEYLNRYRCKKALEMLENSNMTKTEIAHFCGFYDLSHMEKRLGDYSYS